jgi:multiple sugar transport system substrate-binding protein
MRICGLVAAAFILALAGCGRGEDSRTELVVQRFFGACEGQYGAVDDPAEAEGECGIMTALINRFERENPDVRVVENIVFWPGYDQLTAQLASNDAPDLVTMHGSVISDYQARGLVEPLSEADLAAIGAPPERLTEAAHAAVTIDGRIWGLPFDSWAPLWHINMNLFRQAGLVRDGRPVLPRSPEELIAQAEQFKARTGKPYFVQSTANEYAAFARNFYTFVMQQGGLLFPEPRRADFTTDEARRSLALFRQIHDRRLTTINQDYSAAVAGFINGQGGVFPVGTWMVGDFQAESESRGRPLSGGYVVMPYPQLFPARDVTFADGHVWVMPADSDRPPEEREAAMRFLAFFARHQFDWSRTGHLPVFRDVIDSREWRALPHRSALAPLAETATPLPRNVRRQFPIETIVGQEAAAAISGAKPIDQALADMERRVNEILSQL